MILLSDVAPRGLPKTWKSKPFWNLFRRVKRTGFQDQELLSVYRDYGVIPKTSRDDNHNKESEDLSKYQLVKEGDLVTNKMKAWQGSIAVSRYHGIVSPAYYVYESLSKECDQYLHYLLRSKPYINLYKRISNGVRVNQWDLDHEALRTIPILLPDIAEQKDISEFLDYETDRIDALIEKKKKLVEKIAPRIEVLIDVARKQSNWKRFGYCAQLKLRPISPEEGKVYTPLGLYNRGRGFFKKPLTEFDELGDSSFFVVKKNDLVFSGQFAWEGAVGLISDNEHESIVSHRYPVYSGLEGINNSYLYAYFRSNHGQFLMENCSRGAAGRNRPLNTNILEKEKIPVPSSEMQTQVAELVKFEMDLKDKIVPSINLLSEYKSALITAAVTGQINIKKKKFNIHNNDVTRPTNLRF